MSLRILVIKCSTHGASNTVHSSCNIWRYRKMAPLAATLSSSPEVRSICVKNERDKRKGRGKKIKSLCKDEQVQYSRKLQWLQVVITATSAVTFAQSASARSVSEPREKRICPAGRIFNRVLNKKLPSTRASGKKVTYTWILWQWVYIP